MKGAILAGGRGTRLAELTRQLPKPLTAIGPLPILWHICHGLVARAGVNEIVLALGYMADKVTDFLSTQCTEISSDHPAANRYCHQSRHIGKGEDILFQAVDTGLDTDTGGRVKRLQPWLQGERFFLSWCDGLHDIDLREMMTFHQGHGRLATVAAVYPPPRFGRLHLQDDRVVDFQEKKPGREGWINGGVFILEPGIFDLIPSENCSWERDVLTQLSRSGELMAFKHEGFWQCMDTLAEKELLEKRWENDQAPWYTG
ncbi:MAG: glucose-1-phosphate cytidylyltransferase [Magnetococcales bacterium]|nr:glucose-1-phosphate cytidylyltransferase [Magnetococcales bacterium]